MKWLYARAGSGTYKGMEYICVVGRVELDDSLKMPNIHVLTPALPVKMTSQLNLEVVETVRGKRRRNES